MPRRHSSDVIRKAVVATLSLTVLSGCGESASEPRGPLLLGEWGSESALFIALRAGAEVQLECTAVIIDQPIELPEGGTFAIEGRLQTSSAVLGDLPKIRGTGELHGSRVVLSLPVGSGGSLTTLNLVAGVRPQRTELPTCPQ